MEAKLNVATATGVAEVSAEDTHMALVVVAKATVTKGCNQSSKWSCQIFLFLQ